MAGSWGWAVVPAERRGATEGEVWALPREGEGLSLLVSLQRGSSDAREDTYQGCCPSISPPRIGGYRLGHLQRSGPDTQ